MGLFGGILKGIAKIGGGVIKAVASKATGGLSDAILAKLPKKGMSNQAVAAAIKYDAKVAGPSKKPPELLVPDYLTDKAKRAVGAGYIPRPPKPCAYGPRGEDGYCPPKPARGRSSSGGGRAPRPKPPCKYGPRDEQGYCPPRPQAEYGSSAAYGGGRRRRASAFERGLATGVGNVAKAGVAGTVAAAGAARAASTPLSAVFKGGAKAVALNAAKLTGIGLAGLAAYEATRRILLARQLSKQAAEEGAREEATAAALNDARQRLGRALTGSEMAAINLEVERRIQGGK